MMDFTFPLHQNQAARSSSVSTLKMNSQASRLASPEWMMTKARWMTYSRAVTQPAARRLQKFRIQARSDCVARFFVRFQKNQTHSQWNAFAYRHIQSQRRGPRYASQMDTRVGGRLLGRDHRLARRRLRHAPRRRCAVGEAKPAGRFQCAANRGTSPDWVRHQTSGGLIMMLLP
jgi:hypothetical protein